jgi:hypothetical protein
VRHFTFLGTLGGDEVVKGVVANVGLEAHVRDHDLGRVTGSDAGMRNDTRVYAKAIVSGFSR